MEGDLLRRGIGWYLQYEDIIEESQDENAPFFVGDVNPGKVIGFTIGAAYVISPLDFIPDFIPVIGYVDDVMVVKTTTSLGTYLWDLYD